MKFSKLIGLSLLGFLAGNVQASEEITVSHAWAKATAPGQEVGAAFLTLQSKQDTALVNADSPEAGSVEIHSMTMDNGVMKMRKLDSLPLTANKPTVLEPSGYHLMLIGLKKPLKTGEEVKINLHFKNAAGKEDAIQQLFPVKAEAEHHH